ncbi:MAG: hypothetical protein CMJ19_07025 [Phycisphaeraceae bacterium]|nr:hypothetical protein [Phycisphaeraceae bacterium]
MPIMWVISAGIMAFGVVLLVIYLKLSNQKDLAFDYLGTITQSYFNRDGFTYYPAVGSENGRAVMAVAFQNQYDKRVLAKVAFRPKPKLLGREVRLSPMVFYIECPPAGYGHVKTEFTIPDKAQGKVIALETGANVKYPEGKGNRVRFGDGVLIRANSGFVDPGTTFRGAVAVGSFATGNLRLMKGPALPLTLPEHVESFFDQENEPQFTVHWQWGDPPLIPAQTDSDTQNLSNVDRV